MAWKGQRGNTEWKKIFANDVTDKGLISRVNKTAHTTQHQKNKEAILLNNGQKTWKDIFPKRKYRWPTGCEMMSHITNYQGNANQNCNKISPHTCQNGCHQNEHKQQMLVRVWRKGNPCMLLVEMHIGTATVEKQCRWKKWKQNHHMTQEFPTWVYT